MITFGTILEKHRLSPSMLRLVLGGDGLDKFQPAAGTDQYINAQIVPDGATYSVPFDLDRAKSLGESERPRPRRYTVRSWDPVARHLVIDVGLHGDVGYGGRWADAAEIGDRLQFRGPSGSYRPDTEADWYLLIGDESALPSIAASLEAIPEKRLAVVRAVVDSPQHEISLDLPGAIPSAMRLRLDLMWLYRDPEAETALVDAVASLEWPNGRPDIFLHGEAGEVRAVRKHLIEERGIDPKTASISPYWRRGHTDEAWRSIKRQWLADQAADV